MTGTKNKSKDGRLVVADNRRARFDYEIMETFEAGLSLHGTEVKSLREGKAGLGESYATMDGAELKLINAYIPEYGQGNRFNHEPRRPRKLLMHRRQIDRLSGAIQKEGLTVVPLRIYFNEKGFAKAEIALAKGRKAHDKREHLKERSWEREKARVLREHN